ncbi:protein S100-A13-like [Polymixia lowei]
MEAAIGVLVSQFKAYAGRDGSSDFVKRPHCHLMDSLDENREGELTFLEFWLLIGRLANQHGGFHQ